MQSFLFSKLICNQFPRILQKNIKSQRFLSNNNIFTSSNHQSTFVKTFSTTSTRKIREKIAPIVLVKS